MLVGYSRLAQALMGTGFGWFMTAAGAAMVWPLEALGTTPARQRLFLDAALGASAGIMLAASYFSLLAPAIEEAENIWPEEAHAAWVVATVGFLLGGLVMVFAEEYLPDDVVASMAPHSLPSHQLAKIKTEPSSSKVRKRRSNARSTSKPASSRKPRKRQTGASSSTTASAIDDAERKRKLKSWKRILLLVIAISLHNAPEGGAVGVAFGALPEEHEVEAAGSADVALASKCEAIGCTVPGRSGMTFGSAVNVAIGIGLQNFPEGLAVSLPLRREGCSIFTAFFLGPAQWDG